MALHFQDPEDPDQLGYNSTFADLLDGIDTTNGTVLAFQSYADLVFVGDAAFPEGVRRGFYGPQTSSIDVDYLANLTSTFGEYIDKLQDNGERPYSAAFVFQYMFPGLDGRLPASDADTAWPHSVVGHQTLFSPAWLEARDDELTLSAVTASNQITYDRQEQLGEFIANYPSYISPDDDGHAVWGDNVPRLVETKQKYDPECLIRNGPGVWEPGLC